MSSAEEQDSAQSTTKHGQGGAKGHINVFDGTRRRLTAAATIRDKKKLELMTQRRKEADSDDEDNSSNGSGSNNNNGRSGYHRGYDQIDRQEAFENLQDYINMTNPNNNSPENVKKAAFTLRSLLVQDEPNPIPKLRDLGGVEAIVNLLDCPDAQVQYDAIWAATNIATYNDDACDHVMRAGVVPKATNLLVHPTDERIRRQAAWCLGNICGCGQLQRDYCLDNGVLKAVIAAINGTDTIPAFKYEKDSTMRNMAWLVAQLNRFKPSPNLALVSECIPTVRRLLEHPDISVRVDACWCVSFLSDSSIERLRTVFDSGLIEPLLREFGTRVEKFMLPCLRAFGNYSSKDETTNLLFEWKVIEKLHPFLDIQAPRALRKEAAWILSNAICGTKEQIVFILDQGLIPLIVNCIGHPEFEVRKEAAWTVANLAQYAPVDVIRYLVESCGAIDALCHLLSQEEERSCQLALEALEPILVAGNQLRENNQGRNPYADRAESQGGLASLENLVHHVSSALSIQAITILENFYGERARELAEADGGDGYCDYGGENNNDNNEPQPQQNNNNNNVSDGYDQNRNGNGYTI